MLHMTFHVTLPGGITDRWKISTVEYFLRMVCFYPMKYLLFLGYEWQLIYQRLTLHTVIHVFNPLLSDSSLKINNELFSGVPVRVYEPVQRKGDGAIILIHGGGFMIFNVATYEGLAREIARQTGLVIVSLDYRLAPEHGFPSGLADCLNATLYFMEHAARWKVDPKRIAVFGDSAGGNLAAVLAQRLRNVPGVPSLKAQVLFYPLLQFVDFQTPSYQLYHKTYHSTGLLDPESIAKSLLFYFGISSVPVDVVLQNKHISSEVRNRAASILRHDTLPKAFRSSHYERPRRVESVNSTQHHSIQNSELVALQNWLLHPDVSPLMQADLTGLPPTYLATMGFDILRDEGYWYAQRLRAAGNQVKYVHIDDGFHAMLTFYAAFPTAYNALVQATDYLKVVLAS
jgi:acetyl esterase/lipase